MPDQEVHEIQLNGKQLVFMFMAATVVSVVIFLCGVMVGRGVRQPQADAVAASTDPAIDPTAPLPGIPVLSADTTPAPAQDRLTYAERLEAPVASDQPFRPVEPKPTVAPVVDDNKAAPKVAPAVDDKKAAPKVVPAQETKQLTAPKAPAVQPASATKPAAATAGSRLVEPPGNGFVLQVKAFATREAADALAGRLTAKGYAAFVTVNPGTARDKYRVRVGKYSTRREADAVAVRLRQEHFDPWLTH